MESIGGEGLFFTFNPSLLLVKAKMDNLLAENEPTMRIIGPLSLKFVYFLQKFDYLDERLHLEKKQNVL